MQGGEESLKVGRRWLDPERECLESGLSGSGYSASVGSVNPNSARDFYSTRLWITCRASATGRRAKAPWLIQNGSERRQLYSKLLGILPCDLHQLELGGHHPTGAIAKIQKNLPHNDLSYSGTPELDRAKRPPECCPQVRSGGSNLWSIIQRVRLICRSCDSRPRNPHRPPWLPSDDAGSVRCGSLDDWPPSVFDARCRAGTAPYIDPVAG